MNRWSQLRVARLGAEMTRSPLWIGPYACAPQGSGFAWRAQDFRLSDLLDECHRPMHWADYCAAAVSCTLAGASPFNSEPVL
jgi:hypothetical protein